MRYFVVYGYSFLEVFTVLAIFAILTSLALPNYTAFLTTQRMNTEAEKLIAAINFARFEALRRHVMVTLCKSDDGRHCGGQWENGWLVFIDTQRNTTINSPDQILRFYNQPLHNTELTWSASRSNDYLQFSPTGSTYGQAGRFSLTSLNSTKPQTYLINVSQTGRARLEQQS